MIGGSGPSRGGIDLNTPGVGPHLAAIKSPFVGPNGGAVTGATSGVGRGVMQTSQASYQSAGGGMPGSPIAVILGLLGLAALLWFARRESSYLQQNVIGFNTFNVITIGIVASVWIILAKVIFNKVNAGPITTVVNAL